MNDDTTSKEEEMTETHYNEKEEGDNILIIKVPVGFSSDEVCDWSTFWRLEEGDKEEKVRQYAQHLDSSLHLAKGNFATGTSFFDNVCISTQLLSQLSLHAENKYLAVQVKNVFDIKSKLGEICCQKPSESVRLLVLHSSNFFKGRSLSTKKTYHGTRSIEVLAV